MAEVRMYLDHVRTTLKDATRQVLDQYALQTAARTKLNIQQNGQIDTGFMLNSVAAITSSGIQGEQDPSGVYENKAGEQVLRILAIRPELGDAQAAVWVGAEYAIWQELRRSFLYAAGMLTAIEFGGTAEVIYKEHFHD